MLRNRRKREAAAQRLKESQEKVVSPVRHITSPHTRRAADWVCIISAFN
jgi:hypothetical protein